METVLFPSEMKKIRSGVPVENKVPVFYIEETNRYRCGILDCEFSKNYVVKKTIMRHMRTHGTSFPYLCKICQQTYRSLSNIYRHIREIHLESSYSRCLICQTKTRNLCKLKKHLEQEHGIQFELYAQNLNLPPEKKQKMNSYYEYMAKKDVILEVLIERYEINAKKRKKSDV